MNAVESHDHDELALLRDSAAGFVAKHTDHRRTRALRQTEPGYDAGLVKEMAELGWFGILVPDEFDGLGLGFAELGVVMQALGHGLLAEPIVAATVLAGRTLLHTGHEALKGRLLPGLAKGEALFALAWQEAKGGIDIVSPATSAASRDERTRLTGSKRFVVGAHGVVGFLVTATAPDGIALYWVERDAPGLALSTEWRADGSPVGKLTLTDTPAERVATSSQAVMAIGRAFDEAIIMVAAELMGILTEALSRTIEYMKVRVQYDKPIGSFQALQHKAVDLYILQEISLSVIGDAIRALDDPATTAVERSRVASRTNARQASAASKVTRDAVQLHGAIGFTDEHDIGLFLKRALVLSTWLGNADVHRHRFMTLQAPASNT